MSNGTELAVVEDQQPHGLSMIDGPDPMAAMQYAGDVSKAIASVLKSGNGFVEIQGRKHVEAAGWQTIAAMTGHTCEIEWSRIIDGMEHHSGLHSWEARAIVRDQTGRVVATGESMAAAAEGDPQGNKKGAPWARAEFSIRSMAQTRAMGRALSARMRYVVQLAGFQGAPAEEMGDVEREQEAIKTARARFAVLKSLGDDPAAISAELGDNPGRLADDMYFAVVARKLATLSVEKMEDDEPDAPVEGEIVDEPSADAPRPERLEPDEEAERLAKIDAAISGQESMV